MEKIKFFVKYFIEISKKYEMSLYSSSLSFYILLVIIPLNTLIIAFLNILEISIGNKIVISGISGIVFIFNLVWVCSKLVNNMKILSKEIYQIEFSELRIIVRLKSFFQMFFILFILVLLLSLGSYFNYIIDQFDIRFKFLINVLGFLVLFFTYTSIAFFIYKFFIPIKIKKKYILLISIIISTILYIVTLVYSLLTQIKDVDNLIKLYGYNYKLFIFMIWLLLSTKIFIYGLIGIYCLSEKDILRIKI